MSATSTPATNSTGFSYPTVCDIMDASGLGFLGTWALLTVGGWIALIVTAGVPFHTHYMNPTYEKWLHKTNKKYPAPAAVRSEAYKSLMGVPFVTISPTLCLYMATTGLKVLGLQSKAYCGFGKYGWGYEAFQLVFVLVGTDFFEWMWHNLGHRVDRLWEVHRPHHRFPNPSPFAVIADDPPDEVIRGSPLFWLPFIVPLNLELVLLEFTLLFGAFGVALHTGVDYAIFPVHQKWFNSPYYHHLHHALSTKGEKNTYHTGFFFQIWDQMAGTVYKGPCFCSECDAKAGNRTKEAYDAIKKPDYSVLLSPSYWLNWKDDAKEVFKEE